MIDGMNDTVRAWVRLPSRRHLDLLNPTPFDWDDGDLAVGLARTYRWGGHSCWPLPLSVAQHSLTVLTLAARTDPTLALRELLHDADEGLLGFDAISPLKAFLGADYHALVQRLTDALHARYRIPHWTAADKKHHKRADRLAAASEALHVVGWSETEIRRTLKIRYTPLDTDPLHAHYGGTPWEPWPAAVAAERFLDALYELMRQQGAR